MRSIGLEAQPVVKEKLLRYNIGVTSETFSCQYCRSNFRIDAEDIGFYQKIGVPSPTWCPDCRNMRRMSSREDHSLYRETCKLCEKSVVSIHAPGAPFTIYCRECWRSDKWDPMNYGREYDFTQPFFTQFRTLLEAVPRPALTGTNIVNSDFSHACLSCKNCYYMFWSYFSENAQYCYGLLLSKDTYDSYVTDNSDHAYETLHSNRLYKVRFGYFADECLDSSFLFDCVGLSDCFGCVNLRKQKYCLWNQKLSKEEYFAQVKYWDLGSYARLTEAKEKFRNFYLSFPHRYAHVLSSENVTGDIIRDTKNCHTCFSTLDGVQDCKYLYFAGLNIKDSNDVSAGGDTSELLYEGFGITRSQRVCFSVGTSDSRDVAYGGWVASSSDCFGCVSVKHKRYCILNKQYSRAEYETLVAKIKLHMDTMPYTDHKGRLYKFGEFFPTELSAFAYNESFAFPWYPKSKEEVIAEGWSWREPQTRSYQVTVKPENLPDHIRDVSDAILKETIGCLHTGTCHEQCTTAFRITPEELAFYREMHIALPRLCPNCRHAERLMWRNGLTLWRRRCMCNKQRAVNGEQAIYKNTAAHSHGAEQCPNEFETTFPPEKPEIIYCDQCYKAEFL